MAGCGDRMRIALIALRNGILKLRDECDDRVQVARPSLRPVLRWTELPRDSKRFAVAFMTSALSRKYFLHLKLLQVAGVLEEADKSIPRP